jgi:hypothetical protein
MKSISAGSIPTSASDSTEPAKLFESTRWVTNLP